MLVVWICITGLSSIPHDFIRLFWISTDKCTSTRGCNHLVPVEREYSVAAKSAEDLSVKTRSHTFGCILNHRDTIFVSDRHNFIDMVWHPIKSNRDDGLRIFAGLLFPVDDGFLQQLRVHIPCFAL